MTAAPASPQDAPWRDAVRCVRELHWLLLSPPLLDTAPGAHPAPVQHFSDRERHQIAAWLHTLASAPEALAAHMQQAEAVHGAPLRLGHRAERLLAYFLRHGPTHRLVAAHLPLRSPRPGGGQTTRGEIDFLLEDAAGRRWHWELAVKFFLCTASGPTAQADDFIGPDHAETLSHKLQVLFGRQLCHAPPAPWDAHPWQPAAFLRGWLFYPPGPRVPSMPGLHPAHGRGHWIGREQLAQLTPGDWWWLDRPHWMAPAQALAAPLPGLAALGEQLDAVWRQHPARSAALLVARLEQGQEVERVFVRPPGPL